MNILPVQANLNTKNYVNNQKNTTFKSAIVDQAMREVKYTLPKNQEELWKIWDKLFNAIKSDKNLTILRPDIMKDITTFSKRYPDSLGLYIARKADPDAAAFPDIIIARDEKPILTYGKDEDGTYMRVSSKEGWRKMGYTNLQREGRFRFYRDPDTYIDFYPVLGSTGARRTIRTKAINGENTQHCDTNGDSTITSNIRGFIEDVKGLWNTLKNL